MQKDGYGSFGAQASIYSAGRKEFPCEVFYYLKGLVDQDVNVLDLGCGTGISSRQIADQGFKVTGIDIDERMIRQAMLDSRNRDINYVASSANSLPCRSRTFRVVTAFSSFHWFCDEATIYEIKGVLTHPGLLFVVNKNDIEKENNLNNIIKATLRNFIAGEEPHSSKSCYNPAEIMKKHGFKHVSTYSIQIVEKYTPEELLAYVQSMSIWNLVPNNRRTEALKTLRWLVFKGEELVLRPVVVKVIYGFR